MLGGGIGKGKGYSEVQGQLRVCVCAYEKAGAANPLSATVTGTMTSSATKSRHNVLEFLATSMLCHFRKCKHVWLRFVLSSGRCGTVRDIPAAANHARVQGACWLRITWICTRYTNSPCFCCCHFDKVLRSCCCVGQGECPAGYLRTKRAAGRRIYCVQSVGMLRVRNKSALCFFLFFWGAKKGSSSSCALSRVVRGLCVSVVE